MSDSSGTTYDGYVDPNFPSPGGPGDASIIIYGYRPSIALAAFAGVWFFLHFVVHSYRVFHYRSWYFITFPIGLLLEVVGYVARSLSAQRNPYNVLYFVLNYFFIVTAPVFLAAGIYTILSGLINRLGREHSFLAPKVVLWFFIVSDAIATATQVCGAALIGVSESNNKDPTTANNILLGGLAYQVFSMGIFVILAATFLLRARVPLKTAGLTTFAWVFALAAILIYLRTAFRLTETAEGLGGNLSSREVFFGSLEFAPVALAASMYAIWFPGWYIGSKLNGVGRPDMEENKEMSSFQGLRLG